MISMDKIDSIRKRYRRGESVASIARDLQVSRDTVYKYARMEDLSPKMPVKKEKRPSKMDRWAPYVDQWLEDDMRENRKQRPHRPSHMAEAHPRARRRRGGIHGEALRALREAEDA